MEPMSTSASTITTLAQRAGSTSATPHWTMLWTGVVLLVIMASAAIGWLLTYGHHQIPFLTIAQHPQLQVGARWRHGDLVAQVSHIGHGLAIDGGDDIALEQAAFLGGRIAGYLGDQGAAGLAAAK